MTISETIASLTICLEQFGDVHCKFVTSSSGNPAIELHNVDTTEPPGIDADEERIRRFNARFPTRNIFIPSRN